MQHTHTTIDFIITSDVFCVSSETNREFRDSPQKNTTNELDDR